MHTPSCSSPKKITHALSARSDSGKTKESHEVDHHMHGNPVNKKKKKTGASRPHDWDNQSPHSNPKEAHNGGIAGAVGTDQFHGTNNPNPPVETAPKRRPHSPSGQNRADESTTVGIFPPYRDATTSLAERLNDPATDIGLKQHVFVVSECFGKIYSLLYCLDGGSQKQASKPKLWLNVFPSAALAPSWEELRKDFNRAVWISRKFATTVAVRIGVLRKEITPLLQDENMPPEKKQRKLARFLEVASDIEALSQEMLQISGDNLDRMRAFREAYDSSTSTSGWTGATKSWILLSGKVGKESKAHKNQTQVPTDPRGLRDGYSQPVPRNASYRPGFSPVKESPPPLPPKDVRPGSPMPGCNVIEEAPVQAEEPADRISRDPAIALVRDDVPSSGTRPLSPTQNEFTSNIVSDHDEDDVSKEEQVKQAIATLLGQAKYDLINSLGGVDVTTAIYEYRDGIARVIGELIEKQKQFREAEDDTKLLKELPEYFKAHETGTELLDERFLAISFIWGWIRDDVKTLHRYVRQAKTGPELQSLHQYMLGRNNMVPLYENLENALLDYANAVAK